MKRIITFTAVLSGLVAYAQDGRVGINTTTPQAALEISRHPNLPNTQNQGVMFPSFSTAERNRWKDVKESTMFYNTTKKCIDWYDGEKWACADGKQVDYPLIDGASDPTSKAQVWDRTHYIASFDHLGTGKIVNGQISSTKSITLQIAYNEGTGSYNPITVTRKVTNRDGSQRTLTLNIPQGTLDAKGFLTATITADDTYDVPFLGNSIEQELATFNFKIGDTGRTASIRLIGSGGVKDKKYDQKTPGTDNLDHQFVYVPISVYATDVDALPERGEPYERTWLNNNLGAEYANVASTVITNFDPTQQAKSEYDYKAYGSLFEWGRDSDGHEIISWSGEREGSFKYNTEYKKTLVAINNCPAGYSLEKIREYTGMFLWDTVAVSFREMSLLKLPRAMIFTRAYWTAGWGPVEWQDGVWLNTDIQNPYSEGWENYMYIDSNRWGRETEGMYAKRIAIRCIKN